jgi:hypothetical protein
VIQKVVSGFAQLLNELEMTKATQANSGSPCLKMSDQDEVIKNSRQK